jgi:copper chaperone CopZ
MTKQFLLLSALPFLAHAQLLEVKQVIYGMDCAPCARGVEASIKRLDGVQAVTISLNNGTADIRLAPDNRQTLDGIRQRISDNGFSAKEAHITLTGTLREKSGKLVLVTASGETFTLQSSTEAKNALDPLKKSGIGKAVTVVGLVAEGKKSDGEPWNVQVTQLKD